MTSRPFTQELGLLASPEAAGLLHAALTGSTEVRLPGFAVALDRLQHRPGAEVSAGYRVSYQAPDGGARRDYLVVTTAELAGQVATLTHDGLTFRVWRHPADPLLTGLAGACDPPTVSGWLDRAGLGRELRQVELLAYRPLRRAVLRAETDATTNYLKVLRPDRGDRLVRRQRLLADAGLTPEVLSEPAPGVVVSASAPGRSLAEALVAWEHGSGALPSGSDLVDLLDRLPVTALDLPRRPAWSDRLDFHAETAAAVLPDQRAAIAALRARLERRAATVSTGGTVATHGDFYEANIRIDEGRAVGVIDVDSVGPGLREDDLACLLAHLAVLPALAPAQYPRIAGVIADWQSDFEHDVDASALRVRVAGVLLSLVAGAEPGQATERLALAQHWAASAGA